MFSFGDDAVIITEGAWRLILEGRIHVTSEDHNQLFGLGSPIDAGSKAIATVKSYSVKDYSIEDDTGDLSIHFSSGVTLQLINLSSGYESWRASHSGEEVISMGGGPLSISKNAG